MKTSNIGLIGLAVMGENLALNMESKGFAVSVYNRTAPGEEGVVDRFMSGRGKGKNFIGTHTIQEFVESIERPRKIMLMVKAGAPVDELMAQLIPYLSPGDVIIDGGNSDFHDTERRVKEMEAHGMYFVGYRNLRRRDRCLVRTFRDAGWFACCLAFGEGCLAKHRRQVGRRDALLPMDWSGWSRPFRENGTQWYRVWRYAVDFRGVFFIEESSGSGQ